MQIQIQKLQLTRYMDGDPIQQFRDWYATRPIYARTFLTISFILAVANSLGFLHMYQMYYTYDTVIEQGEYWRFFTGLFYLGDIGLMYVFKTYCGYITLYYAEKDLFKKNDLADYLMMVLFLYLILAGLALLQDVYFLCDSFFFALLFIQTRFKPFQRLIFVFDTDVPVKYFIWVYMGFNVLMGSFMWNFLAGFVAGLLYVLIKTTLLRKLKVDLWPTPSIFHSVTRKFLEWSARRDPGEQFEHEDEYD